MCIDGAQTAVADEISSRLRSLELSLRGASIRLAVRVMTIGAAADPLGALEAKLALQTEHAWEPAPLYHAAQPKQLAATVSSLCADTLRAIASSSLELELPRCCRAHHCGFVTQLGAPPRWSVPLRLGVERSVTLLFQGPPPRALLASGRPLPLRVDARRLERRAFLDPSLCAETLRTIQACIGPLRVAAARRHDVRWALGWLRRLSGALAGPTKPLGGGIADPSGTAAAGGGGFTRAFASLSPVERAALLRQRKRLAADIKGTANDVEDVALFSEASRTDGALALGGGGASFLSKPTSMRHGARALRRVGRARPQVPMRSAMYPPCTRHVPAMYPPCNRRRCRCGPRSSSSPGGRRAAASPARPLATRPCLRTLRTRRGWCT